MQKGRDKNYKVGQIRFNFINKHYGHIKAIVVVNNKTKITSVFISTEATSEGQQNEEMTGVLNLNGKEGKYFIRRVRTYDAKTYTDLFIEDALNEEDLAKSNKIYEIYLENKKVSPDNRYKCWHL